MSWREGSCTGRSGPGDLQRFQEAETWNGDTG